MSPNSSILSIDRSEIPAPGEVQDIRCYVLANIDLPPIHAGIQALHASCELVWNHQKLPIVKEWVENHKTVVLLGATLEELNNMKNIFDLMGKCYSEFKEPDLDNLLTAVAFEPMPAKDGKTIFGKFKLFK